MSEGDGSTRSELRVAALISDMDGVLVDTGGVYDRHWELWAEHHGIPPARIIAVHFGRPAAETIRLVAPQLDAVAEARRFNDALAADPSAAGVSAMPGAIELVGAIPPARWAIATSAPRTMAERWLAHVGMPLPSVLVTVDDVARGKPAPDPYLRAAELLGVAAADCLVIEDAPAGVSAARAAGATVLGVLSTHGAAHLADAQHLVAGLDAVAIGPDGTTGALLVRWQPAQR
jgi:sugar-phosphatase